MASRRICSIEGCDKPVRARGWCQAHWLRWYRYGDPVSGGPMREKRGLACKEDGCDKPVYGRGWCSTHYNRWRAHGDPNTRLRAANGGARRFLDKVALVYEGDECLIWPYARAKDGRAVFSTEEGYSRLAHRYVCERAFGPPPTTNHDAAHNCGKGHEGCIAKRHLEWKTKSANQTDRIRHGTSNRGERCGTSRLTEKQVLEIRKMAGTMTHKEIAAIFDIHKRTVGKIINRALWAWLK